MRLLLVEDDTELSRQLKDDLVKSGFVVDIVDNGIDEDRQCVITEDQRTIELTGIEFRLLRYLLLHPGIVLSKTRLTEHVYEFDADKDSNVIEIYINRLRQKIGKDLIETRRGQGYIFRAPK